MQDPQSLHKYLYVHGDPVQGTDPSGEISLAGGLATIGVISIGLATLLPAVRGGYLAASNIATQQGNESIFSFAFLGSLKWADLVDIASGFGDGASAGAYNALDTLTFRQIGPLNRFSTALWDGQALNSSWVGTASNTLAWTGTTALYAAAAVFTWNAAGGGTMDIAISKGPSPWFIHVRYGVSGAWEHAVLGTGRSGLGGMTIVTDIFAGAGGTQITGIPVLLPQAVLTGAAASETACSCVTAAIRAFLRGWGI
jgi:hypothetical protein